MVGSLKTTLNLNKKFFLSLRVKVYKRELNNLNLVAYAFAFKIILALGTEHAKEKISAIAFILIRAW